MAALLALAVLGRPVAAQYSFQLPYGSARSAYRDVSNIYIDFSNFGVEFDTQPGDPDLYINQFTLTPGAGWPSMLDLQLPAVQLNYGGSQPYNLGDPIPGDTHWFFSAASRQGAVDPGVPDGDYHALLQILGGGNSAALDILAEFNLTLSVREKLDIDVTTWASPGTIAQGQSTQVSMKVKNNMAGDDFVSTTWFLSSFQNGSDQLAWTTFDGDWFGKHIAPGDSRTDLHSTWVAGASQPTGLYLGNLGVVGGLYDGDEYFVNNNPLGQITVVPGRTPAVPEPSTLAAISIGALMLAPMLRRRR